MQQAKENEADNAMQEMQEKQTVFALEVRQKSKKGTVVPPRVLYSSEIFTFYMFINYILHTNSSFNNYDWNHDQAIIAYSCSECL